MSHQFHCLILIATYKAILNGVLRAGDVDHVAIRGASRGVNKEGASLGKAEDQPCIILPRSNRARKSALGLISRVSHGDGGLGGTLFRSRIRGFSSQTTRTSTRLIAMYATKVAGDRAFLETRPEQQEGVMERAALRNGLVEQKLGGQDEPLLACRGFNEATTRNDKAMILHPGELDDFQLGDPQIDGKVARARPAGETVAGALREGIEDAGEGMLLLLVVELAHGDAVVDVVAEHDVAHVEEGLRARVAVRAPRDAGGRVVHAGVGKRRVQRVEGARWARVARHEPLPHGRHGQVAVYHGLQERFAPSRGTHGGESWMRRGGGGVGKTGVVMVAGKEVREHFL